MSVDTAAEMAPLTTATKGMERQHMRRDRRGRKQGRREEGGRLETGEVNVIHH